MAEPLRLKRKVRHELKASKTECQCQNWKSAYASKEAVCGRGHEVMSATERWGVSWQEVLPFVQHEQCTTFFERLDSSSCVPMASRSRPEWESASWCYVSPQCRSLNGGRRIAGGSSVKVCHEDDQSLRHLTPLELAELASFSDVSLASVAGAAYPVRDALWADVELLWLTGQSGIPSPSAFNVHPDGLGEMMLVKDKTVWSLNVDTMIPAARHVLTCISGCEDELVLSSHTPPQPSVDLSCECLNWKDTYGSRRASCGQALELVLPSRALGVTEEQVLPFVQLELCSGFFQQLDSNQCISIDPGLEPRDQWYGESWCFVSPRCTALHGGRRVESSDVSWKVCADERRLEESIHDQYAAFVHNFTDSLVTDTSGSKASVDIEAWRHAVAWYKETQTMEPRSRNPPLRGIPTFSESSVRMVSQLTLQQGLQWLKQTHEKPRRALPVAPERRDTGSGQQSSLGGLSDMDPPPGGVLGEDLLQLPEVETVPRDMGFVAAQNLRGPKLPSLIVDGPCHCDADHGCLVVLLSVLVVLMCFSHVVRFSKQTVHRGFDGKESKWSDLARVMARRVLSFVGSNIVRNSTSCGVPSQVRRMEGPHRINTATRCIQPPFAESAARPFRTP